MGLRVWLLSILYLSCTLTLSFADEKFDTSFLKGREKREVDKYLHSNKYLEEINAIIKGHSSFSRKKLNQLLIKENKEMSKKNLLLISWPDDGRFLYRMGEKIIRDRE